MDAFESVIATILLRDGFWVRTSFKVKLTPEDKRKINRPSSPRWELDVLAYRPGDNQLWIVECKSFLDSRGVSSKAFKPGSKGTDRYKLFNEPKTWEVVSNRLIEQLREQKAIRKSPKVRLCLAAGKVIRSEAMGLRDLFDANGWMLFDAAWIREQLIELANDGYDNAVAAVAAKLLIKTKA